jgi:cytochrome c-type biogenesis protein CcmH/NrfG
VKAWLLYTVVRLAIFAAVLVILLLIGWQWYVATVVAALVGLLVSYIALPKLRYQVATSLATRRRTPDRDADTDFEDARIDEDDAAQGVARPASDAERHAALRRDLTD